MTDKPKTTAGRPVGKKDSKQRQRNAPPKAPFEATARNAGRTERISVSGSISPAVHIRLLAEGSELTWPDRLDRAITRLIELEAEANAGG